MKRTIGTFVFLAVLSFTGCDGKINSPTRVEFDSGECGGCWLGEESGLFSLVARSEADYDSLRAGCFQEHFRKRWLPPKPGPGEELLYVSLGGSGCMGCLQITDIEEGSRGIVVEVKGGFQGPCDMLIVTGAWALIPQTDRPVLFQFQEVLCPGE